MIFQIPYEMHCHIGSMLALFLRSGNTLALPQAYLLTLCLSYGAKHLDEYIVHKLWPPFLSSFQKQCLNVAEKTSIYSRRHFLRFLLWMNKTHPILIGLSAVFQLS